MSEIVKHSEFRGFAMLGALVFLAALVASQPANPIAKSQTPIELKDDAGRTNEAEKNGQESDAHPTRVYPVQIVTCPIDKDGSYYSKNECENEASPDRRIVFLTLMLVIVGIVQAFLFWWQLRLIRQTLADTKQAADAADASAQLAGQSLEETKLFNERSLRAYLSTGAESVVAFNIGERIQVTLSAENCGKLPASQIVCVYNIIIGEPNPVTQSTAIHMAHGIKQSVRFTIFPGKAGKLQLYSDFALSESERTAVWTGRKHIRVWGVASYLDGTGKDGVGKPRFTKFDVSTGGKTPGDYWNFGAEHGEAT